VEYCEGASILSLAKKYNFPPSLLARGIVENITIFEKKEVTKAMKDPFVKLSSLENIFGPFRASEDAIQSENAEPLVDPFSGASVKCPIYASRLAREVVEATNSDPLYGPRVEKERNYVGIEYEMILERALSSMSKCLIAETVHWLCYMHILINSHILRLDIPFETEEQLRAKGSSRTPDILFSCPVALKVHKKLLSNSRHGAETIMIDEDDSNYVWKMVCWIDSKVWMATRTCLSLNVRFTMRMLFSPSFSFQAMFGDVKTHQTSVLPQAESYVHRFGPGLILYWFGHAPLELLGTGHGDDVFVIGWDIPDVFMMPTGEFARDGHA
jgi:hypothetical protein